jgi:valyl-tRNA synthetase
MHMRPQSHDIIRTWLFATVVRSHHEFGTVPWTNAALSGWILDPDRKKMSKSKGNVVTPMPLMEQYGTDAVRYWSASARPGVDTAFSEEQMKVGRKLATKLLNVTKFVLGFGDPGTAGMDAVDDPVDRSMLARLDAVVEEATAAFEAFDYARALERTEAFFWWFCDDYVELVKSRAYGVRGDDAAASARVALRTALDALQRLLAPILPFATEEAWSWWHDDSVHRATWPTATGVAGDAALLDAPCEVLAQVRRAKTEAKRSQRAEVAQLTVTAPADALASISAARADLEEAGSIAALELVEGEGDAVRADVELAPADD